MCQKNSIENFYEDATDMDMNLNTEMFGSMIDNVIAGVCFFEYENKKLTPLFINEGFFRMLGYSRVEGMKYLKNINVSLIPDDIPVFEQAIQDVLKDDGAVDVEFRTVTGSGGLRWLHVRGNLYSREGSKYTIVTVIQDISERKNVEEELRLQAERLHILSAAEGERIIDYNAKTDVLMIKSTGEYDSHGEIIISGYMENSIGDTIFSEDKSKVKEIMESLLKSPKHDMFDFRTNRFDDDYCWHQVNLTSLLGTEGYVTRIVGRMINIHEKKLKELDLVIRAEKDALTGLYNKGATLQLIGDAIATEEDDAVSALMIVDLDSFKEVNDTLGHAVGDKVLIDAAEALSNIFKGGDIVGRIGGDEFVVYMRNLNTVSSADILASKVVKKLDFKLPTESGVINVTCSIGIAIFPYHGKTYDDLFIKADKALYTTKGNGKHGYRIYDAASTVVYHANRKSRNLPSLYDDNIVTTIEDHIMQILSEDPMLESALKTSIELMTEHFNFHRGYLCANDSLQLKEKIQYAVNGYEYGSETNEHYSLRMVFNELLFKFFNNVKIIYDYDITEKSLLEYFQKEGIKSMLYYPITSKGKYQGAIVFENHEDVQFELSETQMEEICSMLRIIEAHIFKIGFTDGIHGINTLISLFDNLDNYVYLINKDTYELQFINKKVLMKTPQVKIGDICYKAIQGKDSPCAECILNKLNAKDPHSRHTEEIFNYSLRCWTRCSASYLECKKKDSTVLLNAIDISEYFIG